jgi:hypothetical protein
LGLHLVELINNQLKILASIEGDAYFFIEKSKADVYWIASLNGLIRIKIVNDKIISKDIYNETTNPGFQPTTPGCFFMTKAITHFI